MGKTVTGYLSQVQAASLWAGLPFCVVVLLVHGYSRYMVAFGSVALALQTYPLPRQVEVAVRQLSLSASDEKQYGLYDGLYHIEVVLHS